MFAKSRTIPPAAALGTALALFSALADARATPPSAVLPRAAEVRTLYRDIPHREPWRRDLTRSESAPGVYLGDERMLAFAPRVERALGVTLRPPRDIELSLNYLNHDRELGLALYSLDRQGPRASRPGDLAETSFARNFDYSRRGQELRLVRLKDGRPEEASAFFEGVVSGRTPGGRSELPALEVSTIGGQLNAGDLVFQGSALLGIVFATDDGARRGRALPAELIAAFVQQSRALGDAAGRPVQISEWRDARPEERGSFVTHPGFEYTDLSDAVARRYYGLAPDTQAVYVTRVYRWLEAAGDRLQVGDVIVGVRGRPLLSGGMASDARFGRVPLAAALVQRDGVLAPRGARVRLDLLREGEKRSVEIGLYLFDQKALRAPDEFREPAYWIAGGLVFVELSGRYLAEGPASARLQYLYERQAVNEVQETERYVVLHRILPTKASEGYGGEGALVLSLNGVAVRSLRHLRDLAGERIRAGRELSLGLEGGRILALAPEELKDADREVRERHGIRYLEGGLDDARAP